MYFFLKAKNIMELFIYFKFSILLSLLQTIVHTYSSIFSTMRYKETARYNWAAMSHLTATTMDVFFSHNDGIRTLADKINRFEIEGEIDNVRA